MTPTKKQKERRDRPFTFTGDGSRSWFYLCEEGASFHQPTEDGQQDVHGLRIKTLVKALKACGYIALLLLLPVVAEAKMEIGDGPPGNVTAAEIWADQRAKHKQVITNYDDFLQILAKVEHSEKLKTQAMAEKGVLLKLKDEQGTIIKVQADQIQACESIVKEQEKLGATQEQINTAVGIELGRVQKELDREKRLSRYKSEAFWMGVVAVGLWVMN